MSNDIEHIVQDLNDENLQENYKNSKILLETVGDFIADKKNNLQLYGGYAINLLLPHRQKIYKEYTINDFDCFCPNALKTANKLAVKLKKKGFEYIKIRKAMHNNTYKIYVNFITVLDITQIDKRLFDSFTKIANKEKKTSIYKYYKERYQLAPYAFLMSNLHFELARPKASYFRWEKIYQRLQLFSKLIDSNHTKIETSSNNYDKDHENVCKLISSHAKKNSMPIIGEFALKLHGIKGFSSHSLSILSMDIDKTKIELMKIFKSANINNVVIKKSEKYPELINPMYNIFLNNIRIASIMNASTDCYSYITKKGHTIGSIDCIMYFMYVEYIIAMINNDKNAVKLWSQIQYLEHYARKHLYNNPKKILSKKCYGVNYSLVDILKKKWMKKQTLKYL
jgi:hypothetical protein